MSLYLPKNTLIPLTAKIVKTGKKIVMTHGVFDLYHIGHSELLKKSKSYGDILIVGLDSDKRVENYKMKKPYISLKERAGILMENKNVDFVVSINSTSNFSDDYLIKLYKDLNVSVVTYGRFFGFKKNIEKRKKILRNVDFKLVNHKYENIVSSTKIIEKIKNS